MKAVPFHHIGSVLKHETSITYSQKRHLFKILNSALNKFDVDRFKQFGPDRVCAEWILRSGGRLRWAGSDHWISDYNFLPSETAVEHYKVVDLDGSGSGVMRHGFEHIRYLEHIKSIKLHDCKYVDNYCLQAIQFTWNTLERLQVSSCKKITDEGLMYITELINLKDLHLKDLRGVKDKLGCYEKLHAALPNCDIIYVDVEPLLGKNIP